MGGADSLCGKTTNNQLAIEGPEGSDDARPAAHGHVHRPGGEDAGGHRGHDTVGGVRHRVQSPPDQARGALTKNTNKIEK